MIELKLIYAGRAREVEPVAPPLGLTLSDVLVFDSADVPQEFAFKALKAWEQLPLTVMAPLRDPVGDAADHVIDLFIHVYAKGDYIYPTLLDATFSNINAGVKL